MKRIKFIVPTLLLGLTLSGCSLVSNLFNNSKKEPSFENKGEEVTVLEFSSRLLDAYKGSKLYYDSNNHLPSMSATANVYMKQSEKNVNGKNKSEDSLEVTGKGTYKYDSNNLVATTATETKYTQKMKSPYGSNSGSATYKQDNVAQISNGKLYTIDKLYKTYQETELGSSTDERQMMDQVVGSQVNSLINFSSVTSNEKAKYYINGDIFTVSIDDTESEALTNWADEKVGYKDITTKATYQLNLAKFTMKQSDKTTYHYEYTQAYNSYDKGDVVDRESVTYGTSTIKFSNVKIETLSLSGYRKTSSSYDY